MNEQTKDLLAENLVEAPLLGLILVDVATRETATAWRARFAPEDPNLVALEAFLIEVRDTALKLNDDVCERLEIE